jgi:hypothetical protein
MTYQRITNVGRDHLEIEDHPSSGDPGSNYFAELYHSGGFVRWEFPVESTFNNDTGEYISGNPQFAEFSQVSHDIIIYKYNATADNTAREAIPIYRIEQWVYQPDEDDDGALVKITLTDGIFDFGLDGYISPLSGNDLKTNAQAAGSTAYGDAPGETIAEQVYLYQALIHKDNRDAWDGQQPPNAKLFDFDLQDDKTAVQIQVAYTADGVEYREDSRISGRDIAVLFTNTPPS